LPNQHYLVIISAMYFSVHTSPRVQLLQVGNKADPREKRPTRPTPQFSRGRIGPLPKQAASAWPLIQYFYPYLISTEHEGECYEIEYYHIRT